MLLLNGHLEVLQWLISNECPLDDKMTSDFAAIDGHLEVLQWLRENGYNNNTPHLN